MDFLSFKEKFENALSSNEVLTFYAHCSVKYSGRAESFLERGDRIIIIKADNTLLVHQPENSNPINYMKNGTSFQLEKKENHFLLLAKNLKLKEYLTLDVFKMYDIMIKKMEDGQTIEITGTEADMSNMIKENPNIISEDFIPLSREEHTKFGFIDVFGHDGKGNLVVIECKRYSAGLDAVQQLRRYVEKIKEVKGIKMVRGIIASPSITPNAEVMLKKWKFSWVRVDPPLRLEKYNKNQKNLGEF